MQHLAVVVELQVMDMRCLAVKRVEAVVFNFVALLLKRLDFFT
jgi:hypothetical protein